MNISIWDKEKKEYIEIHYVTWISNICNEIKVETKTTTHYYNGSRYTLDFINGSV